MQVKKMMIKTFHWVIFLQIILLLICSTAIVSAKDELYIIGYGTTPGSAEETSLKELATRSGGVYMSAADTSTPDQLKGTLTEAFIGKETPPPTQIPVVDNSTCDCVTYDPYYDETSECYLSGKGCSECFEACYEGEENTPSTPKLGACNCGTYDSRDESLSCIETGRDCSECFYKC